MNIDPKWWTREKWTLIEAAQICAGVNPYLGQTPTDSPHVVAARIEDTVRRELFEELYSRSKDAVSGNLAVEEPTRTGKLGNVRVRPFAYAMWVIDLPLPEHLEALVPKHELGKAFGDRPSATKIGPHEVEELGPTFEEAARTLAQVGGVVERAISDRMWQAVQAGELELVNPDTKLPRNGAPPTRRDWFDRVRVEKLNEWLATNNAPYRYPEAQPADNAVSGNATGPRPITRKTVIATFKVMNDEAANKRFWDDKLSTPPKWLIGARVEVGKPGRSSKWNPVWVAAALLDESKKGRPGMTLPQLDRCMAKLGLKEQWDQASETERQ